MDHSQKFQPSNNWNNSSVSGHSRTANYCSNDSNAVYNERIPERNRVYATPRPPLHTKPPGSMNSNDRLVLCKVCGSLSADMSVKCCQGGKDSKFALSPSISIGPAVSIRDSQAPKEASKIKIPMCNLKPNYNEKDDKLTAKEIQHTIKVQKDPVILLLSSDDEAPEVSVAPRLKKAAQRELALASVIEEKKEVHLSPVKDEMRNDILQFTELEINSIYEPFMCIKCKKVNIGSYRTYPTERILFMQTGVRFSVSHPTSSQESVTIALPTKHLLKIFWYSGSDTSFLVFYVKEKLAQHIRQLLGMHIQSEIYFDPGSDDDSEKKLVIFLGELTEDMLNQLNLFYSSSVTDFFQKIDDVKPFLPSINNQGHSETSGGMSPTDPNIICHFSPRGSKGAITLTLDDYLCLEEGEFLNDVIIDFYIRYLILKRFDPSVAARTHVFSTFFYKRLSAYNKSSNGIPPDERRHNRVQNWTKGVDIFDKDFIIIPINTKVHWYLAIICFPYLKSPVGFRNNVKQPWRPLRKRKKMNKVEEIEDIDESDRDEASSEDSDTVNDEHYEVKESVRQPCIIIFDSFKGQASRGRVVATLRNYLQMEFYRRKGVRRLFNKVTMRGIYPEVPQQTNNYDCGVYTLQYVESFFANPLTDYSQTLSLHDWFEQEEVTTKREEIMQLFKDLRKEQFPNTNFNFPLLTTRAEINQYQLNMESQAKSPVSSKDDSPEEQSSEEAVSGTSVSWADSFKNSFSALKHHFHSDVDVAPKRQRLDSRKPFCDS